jgi:peptidoglycan/xylan/chitin deacetylase (PgdA/CDA1 family)
MKTLLQSSSRQKLKSAVLVGTGLSRFARVRATHETTILAFHGLCEDAGDDQVLDASLHLPLKVFRRVCAFLASNYRVIRLQDLVDRLAAGQKPEPHTVVLTFDDGYASNFHLAWPVLREFHLPATIFLATGFVDGTEPLWFQRLDAALARTQHSFLDWRTAHGTERLRLAAHGDRLRVLKRVLLEWKRLPFEDLLAALQSLEEALEVRSLPHEQLPAPMQPMTWEQARQMQKQGLVDFGGHTHTHAILGRSQPETMEREIHACRDRLLAELGHAPKLFAYPNGGAGDYAMATMEVLQNAGFQASCTMQHGRVADSTPSMELPRYGSPESVWEAEATVSGAFEAVKTWREAAKNSLWSLLT